MAMGSLLNCSNDQGSSSDARNEEESEQASVGQSQSYIASQAEATAAPSQQNADDRDELSADRPQVITGAYLACAPRQENALSCGFFNDHGEQGLPKEIVDFDYGFKVILDTDEELEEKGSANIVDGLFEVVLENLDFERISLIKVNIKHKSDQSEIEIEYEFEWDDEKKKEKIEAKTKVFSGETGATDATRNEKTNPSKTKEKNQV